MISQKDVAKKAGVSFMTISRVINNKGNVDEKTRAKVLRIIKEMGYYPNILGRGLNTNTTGSISVIIPFTTHIFGTEYYTELLNGVERACAENNYEILLNPKKEEITRLDYLKSFLERKSDGLLIIAPRIDDEQIRLIDEKSAPCVVIDGRQAQKNIVFIDGDNIKGGFLATEHLVRNNHTKIGFLSGWEFVRNGDDRLKGYRNALKKYQIGIRPEYIRKGDFTYASGYAGMMELLKLAERPTAVFAANDLMAMGALKAAKEMNLKIPDDISLVGYDDIAIANYVVPPLTTIKQFSYEMGYTAALYLIRKIRNKGEKLESRIFDVELIERDSVRKL
ncbi:MAG: LacI family DNA-binding transcriptional regulator [bacterium]|nr:LacI family DNA-binding transcriptional regulator [bacterium]